MNPEKALAALGEEPPDADESLLADLFVTALDGIAGRDQEPLKALRERFAGAVSRGGPEGSLGLLGDTVVDIWEQSTLISHATGTPQTRGSVSLLVRVGTVFAAAGRPESLVRDDPGGLPQFQRDETAFRASYRLHWGRYFTCLADQARALLGRAPEPPYVPPLRSLSRLRTAAGKEVEAREELWRALVRKTFRQVLDLLPAGPPETFSIWSGEPRDVMTRLLTMPPPEGFLPVIEKAYWDLIEMLPERHRLVARWSDAGMPVESMLYRLGASDVFEVTISIDKVREAWKGVEG